MTVLIETVTAPTAEVLAAYARLLPQLSSSAKPLDEAALARVLASDATTLLVARLDGAIVGTLALVVVPLPTGGRAHIEDVVVDAAARGHGVGARLVDRALELATAAGARTVDLTSRPSREAANRLYERAGFVRRESTVLRYTPAPQGG
ncbi:MULTISPECIES: GNAT family N-acetyltransferase [Kitasatospora]|uniref:Putative acetyltransferase n=1 Tax=Kitasatospora setae (strain ATCC 33774 / DSM 43861 / JCM 3304 / KCC A-0304 / NBRC 14216 / KM-6054) TaxID=452652 RepID=E4N075_KITSK|nr:MULTISPECIES: GNAT family N-acetyltransferase [Kitasatospora]BAJ31403.1 putative acetyltransferase [Kitasatospora setae KM-6054]